METNQPVETAAVQHPPQFRLRTMFTATLLAAGYWCTIRWLGSAAPCVFIPAAFSSVMWLLYEISIDRRRLDWLAIVLILLSIAGVLLSTRTATP